MVGKLCRCGTRIAHGQVCPVCGPARRQLTTSQRGYNHTHRKRRQLLLASAIGNPCPICHQPMLAGQQLDLHHTTPLATNPYSLGDTRLSSGPALT